MLILEHSGFFVEEVHTDFVAFFPVAGLVFLGHIDSQSVNTVGNLFVGVFPPIPFSAVGIFNDIVKGLLCENLTVIHLEPVVTQVTDKLLLCRVVPFNVL